MNDFLTLSDDELADLVYKSQATVEKVSFSTEGILGRTRKFSLLYHSLPSKPGGAALIYQEARLDIPRFCLIGQGLAVGRSPRTEENPAVPKLAFKDDETMSRRHFEITVENGCHVLRDMDSTTGTYLNGGKERISNKRVLTPGDIICAGAMEFAFCGD